MIIRIPEKGSKGLRKGSFIKSRIGSLSHRVVVPQNEPSILKHLLFNSPHNFFSSHYR
jgi:hypothetical protein